VMIGEPAMGASVARLVLRMPTRADA